MINDSEICPSNQAKCKGCNKFIPKDELRGIEIIKGGMYSTRQYYCNKCSLKKIEQDINNLKLLKEEFIPKGRGG